MILRILAILVCGIALFATQTSALAGNMPLPPNAIEFTRSEIQSGHYGQDLFQILSLVSTRAGITFKSSSDVGAEDWLLIRGFPRDSSRNVLVLFDGRPINTATSDAVEISDVPIDLIERIIIYRPPIPPRFGGYQSVVEIISRKPEQRQMDLSVAPGSKNTRRYELTAEGSSEIGYLFNFERFSTDNLTGVARTPPFAHIVYGDRSYESNVPALKLTRTFGENLESSLYLQRMNDRKSYSDTIFRGEQEQRKRAFRYYGLNVSSNRDSRGDGFSATIFRNYEEDRLNLMMHPDFRHQHRYRQGARGYWSGALPVGNARLAIGGDLTRTHAHEMLGTSLPNLENVTTYGLFAEGALPIGDGISATAGVRLDGHSEGSTHVSPYVNAAYSVSPGSKLYAVWGHSTRWPSLSEFDAALGREDGGHAHHAAVSTRVPGEQTHADHKSLCGERLTGIEVGWSANLLGGRAHARVSGFRLNMSREAVSMSIPGEGFFYVNSPGTTRSQGIEMETDFLVNDRMTAFANYTWNPVKVQPENTSVRYGAPKSLANLGATYRVENTMLYGVVRHRGKASGVQRMRGTPTTLSGHQIVDLAATRSFSGNRDVFVRVGNLFNTQYQTFEGRPMFGRTIMVGTNLRF